MRVGLMTREYPPAVYGGAGVHVEYLSRELAKRIEVEVHCWGDQRSETGNLHVFGALRGALCPDHAQPGAAARLEGGAAGFRLCHELVDGAYRHAGRRRRDRGLARHEGRYLERLS